MEKRWAGRVAECSGLENRRRFVAFPGFESLAHRHLSFAKQVVTTQHNPSLHNTKTPSFKDLLAVS